MAKPPNVPDDAVMFPASPQFSFYQPMVVFSIQSQVSTANDNLTRNWKQQCNDWLFSNGHSRDMGIALAPKPVAPFLDVVMTAHDDDPGSPTFGAIWIWEVKGARLDACPDLPAIAPTHANTIEVGKRIAGSWFVSGPGDTCPNGFDTPPGFQSADGVVGTFEKITYPFGGWWFLKAV